MAGSGRGRLAAKARAGGLCNAMVQHYRAKGTGTSHFTMLGNEWGASISKRSCRD